MDLLAVAMQAGEDIVTVAECLSCAIVEDGLLVRFPELTHDEANAHKAQGHDVRLLREPDATRYTDFVKNGAGWLDRGR